jgi:hypothetical protein
MMQQAHKTQRYRFVAECNSCVTAGGRRAGDVMEVGVQGDPVI